MTGRHLATTSILTAGLILLSCSKKPDHTRPTGEDPNVTTMGSIEVTARLAEIPEGAIFKRELYNYTTVLKYNVLKVHRGQVEAKTIYVGHYNPFKPRSEAADKRVTGIGGNLRSFRSGQIHRMALEVPIDDYYMGGIINKYFGKSDGPIYWAVWTNEVSK
ncbi:MAG: hypothetical protein MUO33_12755 [Sedimentisphaerales bacterium]|nr:hypothetical protein [Sedimentisphaerales bacterium]